MLSILLVPTLVAPTPQKKDTPPFELFSEYVRELGELWSVQQKVDQEMAEDKGTNDPVNRQLMTSIRHSTRMSLILQTNISVLGKMRLTRKPHEKTLGLLIGLYKQKLRLHDDFSKIASSFVGEPKPGVDYGEMAAKLPKLNAMLENVDQTLFQTSALMFMSLIDMKEDSQKRANHLLISRAQRDELVREIDNAFGANLGNDKRYVASTASLIKEKLLEFQTSDEPWD